MAVNDQRLGALAIEVAGEGGEVALPANEDLELFAAERSVLLPLALKRENQARAWVLPVAGTEGVALLLTVVVALMSCFGLGGVALLCNTRKQREGGACNSLPPWHRE
jgi:hypothetical protein